MIENNEIFHLKRELYSDLDAHVLSVVSLDSNHVQNKEIKMDSFFFFLPWFIPDKDLGMRRRNGSHEGFLTLTGSESVSVQI